MTILLFASSVFNNLTAQVVITVPSLYDTATCQFPTPYVALGNIVIRETATGDFTTTAGINKTLKLNVPINFQFLAGTGSVSVNTGNIINLLPLNVTATSITVSYRVNVTTLLDTLTISGIQVLGINSPSGPSNLVRATPVPSLGNTAIINGDVAGTIHANFTSVARNAVILVQPIATAVCEGGITSFNISTTHAPSYQWQENQGAGFVNLTNTPPYSNVTSAILTVSNALIGMSGFQYQCIVTGAQDVCTSAAVSLTVNPAPTITSNPTDTTVCQGFNASFSVVAIGAISTYTWFISTNSGFSFSPLTIAPPYSVSANSLLITAAPASFNGYQYKCVADDGVDPPGCGPGAESVSGTLTVRPTTTVSAAGPDQTAATTCGLTTVPLAANLPSSGTGNWTIVSGTGGTIADTTSRTSNFTGIAGNTYVLRWTISNAPCAASTDDVSITFNINPTTAAAGPDQTGAATCGLTTVTLAGNAPAVGTGNWSIFSGTGGTIATPADTASAFSGTAGNTYVLRWTISNAPCTASIDSVSIRFNINPTPAAAGPDQTGATTCGLTSVTLAANAPSIGTGSWSIFSGAGGNVITPASPTSTFTGITGTTYLLIWTTSNPPCVTTDTVTITFNQNPTPATAGSDQTGAATCGLTVVTLAANAPGIGTGVWSILSGAGGIVTTPASPISTFTGTAGTTYLLIWTTSNPPCVSTDTVTITFNINPTTANAGLDTATCGLTSLPLAANAPGIGTGIWSIFSGAGGSIATPASPTSTFTGTAGTTYILRWTISNLPCTASTDDVTITFNIAPTSATAGPDQTNAATCGLTSLTLAGNAPGIGTGSWSIFSGIGGIVTTPASPTSTFTGTAGNTYILVWTISNAPCAASSDTVTIKFNIAPTTATAGPDQTGAVTCGLTSVALAGNTPAVGTGLWFIFSGAGGTVIAPANPTSAFTGITGNTYTLIWTISNAPCFSTDTVIITFNQAATVATAGPDQTNAATCGLTSLTLAANTPAVGTGSWSIFSGVGGSFALATNPGTLFNGTAGNSYILVWTISNAPCFSTDTVNITFNQNPTVATAGTDQTNAATCGLTSLTLAANTPAIGTGIWSIVSGIGGIVTTAANPASTFTGTAGNTYILVWTISSAPCTASTDTVTITFNIAPTTATAGPDQTGAATCGFTSFTLAANAPSIGTGSWSIFSGVGGVFVNATDPTTGFSGTLGSTYILVWTISNTPCVSTDTVTITFNQFPTTAAAGIDQTLCLTSATLAANTPAVGTGSWNIFTGAGGTVITPTSPTSNFTGTAGNTYVLVWTISNAPCTVSTDTVTIIFNPKPIVVINDPAPVCSPDTVNLTLPAVKAGSTGGLTFTYFTDAGATNVMVDSSNVLASGIYYIVGTTALGCSDTTAVTVSVDAIAIGGSVGTDAFVCNGANGDTLTLTGASSTVLKWQYSITGGTTWIDTANTTTEFIYSNITTTTWYRAITTEFCADAISIEARITVDTSPLPIGGTVSANDTVCSGINSDTLFLTGHTGNIVRWEYSIDNGTTWVYINDTTASLIYTNLTTTTIYHAVLQNSICNFAISSNDTITVDPVSVAGSITGGVSGCAYVNGAILTLSGYTGTVVNWQYSIDEGTTWIDSANVTDTMAYSNLTDTVFYRAIVNSGVCLNDTSDAAEINIYPKPMAMFVSDTSCFGVATTFVNMSTIESGTIQLNQWDFGNSSSSTLLNPTHIFAQAGAGTVSLITTSNLGCLDTATVSIFVDALPDPQIVTSGALSFCCGGSVSMSGLAGLNYSWSTSATTQAIVVSNCLASGNYALTVTDPATLCKDSSSVAVVIFPSLVANAGADNTISLGDSYTLNGQGGSIYSWLPATGLSNPNIFNPIATPVVTTTYELTVADINGCNDMDSVTITVIIDFNLTVSNLMTANGDGYNDIWIVKNIENYPGTEAIVVNREGQQVFYSSSYDNSWLGLNKNGNPLPDGTYYYFLKLKNSDKIYKGPLTILNEK